MGLFLNYMGMRHHHGGVFILPPPCCSTLASLRFVDRLRAESYSPDSVPVKKGVLFFEQSWGLGLCGGAGGFQDSTRRKTHSNLPEKPPKPQEALGEGHCHTFCQNPKKKGRLITSRRPKPAKAVLVAAKWPINWRHFSGPSWSLRLNGSMGLGAG